MDLFYSKGAHPNVGDDFNELLWPHLWPHFAKAKRWDHLVGIGTILDNRLDGLPGRKVVAGAGARPDSPPPSMESVEIGFVRGNSRPDIWGSVQPRWLATRDSSLRTSFPN